MKKIASSPAARIAAAAFAVMLIAAACSSSDNNAANGARETGELGQVIVPAGEQIQIRLLHLWEGQSAATGITSNISAMLAIADYGDIRGFTVDFGPPLLDPCEPIAGADLARDLVADPQIVGIVGPTCSASAVGIAPVFSEAGLSLISIGTSPDLTSDLAGNKGSDNHAGFYRSSYNDAEQTEAIAQYLYNERQFTTAATLHTSNAYSQGLAESFAAAFERLGGTITTLGVANTPEEVVTALAGLAADTPQALQLAIYPHSDLVVSELAAIPGLENTLIITDGSIGEEVVNPASQGVYFAVPDINFTGEDGNTNQSTNQSADDFVDAYLTDANELPAGTFWAHTYDGAVLLLEAIEAASYVNDDGALVIDREGIRGWLNEVADYEGLSGNHTCDEFGDCGEVKTLIVYNDPELPDEIDLTVDQTYVDLVRVNVVYEYSRS